MAKQIHQFSRKARQRIADAVRRSERDEPEPQRRRRRAEEGWNPFFVEVTGHESDQRRHQWKRVVPDGSGGWSDHPLTVTGTDAYAIQTDHWLSIGTIAVAYFGGEKSGTASGVVDPVLYMVPLEGSRWVKITAVGSTAGEYAGDFLDDDASTTSGTSLATGELLEVNSTPGIETGTIVRAWPWHDGSNLLAYFEYDLRIFKGTVDSNSGDSTTVSVTPASQPGAETSGSVTVRLRPNNSGNQIGTNARSGDDIYYVLHEDGTRHSITDFSDEPIGTVRMVVTGGISVDPPGWEIMDGTNNVSPGSGVDSRSLFPVGWGTNSMGSALRTISGNQEDWDGPEQGAENTTADFVDHNAHDHFHDVNFNDCVANGTGTLKNIWADTDSDGVEQTETVANTSGEEIEYDRHIPPNFGVVFIERVD